MLSLVERGLASPSIGSLIVIANALNVTMSDLVLVEMQQADQVVVRAAKTPKIETAEHVIRRVLREDRSRGFSVAVNEYAPHTGSAKEPGSHEGFECGYVIRGTLTVKLDDETYKLGPGDFIAFESRRPHRFWNHGSKKALTVWFNVKRD